MRKLEKEDYVEPRCPLDAPDCACGHPRHHHRHQPEKRLDLPAIIAECDRLFNAEKTAELGEYLRRCRTEARELGDKSSELSILNEMLGHYRMANDAERGLPAVFDALALLRELGAEQSVSGATIKLNAGTALKVFGRLEEALKLYDDAFRIYGRELDPADWRFAGLLNNLAAAYAESGDLRRAEAYYRQALSVLKKTDGKMDAAVTHVNLAQLYHQENPDDDRIGEELDAAMAIFDAPDAVYDGYYAHTCRKCASAFGFFGRTDAENELNGRADALYAGD